jgi:hypothetical protein
MTSRRVVQEQRQSHLLVRQYLGAIVFFRRRSQGVHSKRTHPEIMQCFSVSPAIGRWN